MKFTAGMETQLDEVAEGKVDWVAMMRRWYDPFAESITKAGTEMESLKTPPREAGQDCPTCGKPMVIRASRYGEFISCSAYPECKTIVRPEAEKSEGECPNCGKPMVPRAGRFGASSPARTIRPAKRPSRRARRKLMSPAPSAAARSSQKRSKKGATFFGCNNYPKCDFVAWGKPVGRLCPKDGGPSGGEHVPGRPRGRDQVQQRRLRL